MKTTSLLAAIGAATFPLTFAFGVFSVATYTLTAAAIFALIVASDYAPRTYGYLAGRRPGSARQEQLPYAA